MDALDLKILRQIGRSQSVSPFPSSIASLRKISSRVGVDKETVRNRLLTLERKEILSGWHSMVNPNLLSMKATRFWLEFPTEEDKEAGVEKLANLENVRVVYDYVGITASFVLVHNIAESKKDQLGKANLPSRTRIPLSATLSFPASNAKITETDWSIYRSIREDPRKPQETISKETGVPVRTVKRRLSLLSKANAFLVAPDVNVEHIEGVAADLILQYAEPDFNRVKRDTMLAGEDCIVQTQQFDEPYMLFFLAAGNVSVARTVYQRVRAISGVAQVRLFILHRIIRPRSPLRINPTSY